MTKLLKYFEITEAIDIIEPIHYRWEKGEGLHFPYREIFNAKKEG